MTAMEEPRQGRQPDSLHQLNGTNQAELSSIQTESFFPSLDEVEEILGYEFKNKCLLQEALTHKSYNKEESEKCFSYERLEYVGDSVLNLLFTKEQYFAYPDLAPGPLTRLRSANVDTEKLARVAMKLELHRYLRHEKPGLKEQIEEFSDAILEYPLHSNGLVKVPKILADIVESTVGAIYVDSNCSTDIVWKVFKHLLEPMISLEMLKLHPMTSLYEFCQKNNLTVKFMDLLNESGDCIVYIEDKAVGKGKGVNKEIAHNRAANDALSNISKVLKDQDNVETYEDNNSINV